MATEGLAPAFLGALQASVAVLLTIGYGVIASQYGILRDSSAKDISKLCVKMFLPALLISNVGPQLRLDNLWDYFVIIVWSLFYGFSSMGLGYVATKMFKFPSWTTPAVAFNNTTSLPLVLVQALDATGILSGLLMGADDSTAQAIKRAKSYFLICSMIGNSLTFALGPKLLDGEESPDEPPEENKADEPPRGAQNGDVEHGQGGGDQGADDDDDPNEQTSLLPSAVNRHADRAADLAQEHSDRVFDKLPSWLQTVVQILKDFLVAPLIGAIVAAVIGLTPPLHRIFFNPMNAGGYADAWLTTSIKNIGELFAALQLVVVGSKLSGSLRNMKEDKASGELPYAPMAFVFAVRFLLWPLISIPLIYVVAAKTSFLGSDPMLWFCMMLMPTGPPAIKLTALADVNGSNEMEKMAIAKFLTIAYSISPLICFAVVGSLKAAQAAMA